MQQHNLRQPLNVISLTIANFRLRIEPKLDEVDAIYVNRKLERIEGELQRLAKMLDELAPERPLEGVILLNQPNQRQTLFKP